MYMHGKIYKNNNTRGLSRPPFWSFLSSIFGENPGILKKKKKLQVIQSLKVYNKLTVYCFTSLLFPVNDTSDTVVIDISGIEQAQCDIDQAQCYG